MVHFLFLHSLTPFSGLQYIFLPICIFFTHKFFSQNIFCAISFSLPKAEQKIYRKLHPHTSFSKISWKSYLFPEKKYDTFAPNLLIFLFTVKMLIFKWKPYERCKWVVLIFFCYQGKKWGKNLLLPSPKKPLTFPQDYQFQTKQHSVLF